MRKHFLAGVLLVACSMPIYAEKLITINLTKQTLTATDGNNVFLHTEVSTGRYGHQTPNGTFRAFEKVKDNISTLYPKRDNGKSGGAPMPYTIRVTHDGVAIHEGDLPRTEDGDVYPDSHGCIRAPRGTAKKLFDWTDINTPIKIIGKTKYEDKYNDLRRRYAMGEDVALERYHQEFDEWGHSYYEDEYEDTFVYKESDMDYIDNL